MSTALSTVTLRPARPADRRFTRHVLSDEESRVWLGGYDSYWHADRDHQPPSSFVLIGTVDARPVSFVHALSCDEYPGEAELCIAVDPNERGRGLGQQTIRALTTADLPFWALRAKVHPHNAPSREMLLGCGFAHLGMCEDELFDVLRLGL